MKLGFVDEERFAMAFSRDKFRQNKWGKVRIRIELERRGLESSTIEGGLGSIPENEYLETIQRLVDKKKSTLRDTNKFILHQKVVRYLVGKGFEADLVWDQLND